MRLLKHLSEAVNYNGDYKSLADFIVPLIKKNYKLTQLPVIWRGWNSKDLFYYAEVSGANDREMMRGMLGLPDKWKNGTMKDWVKDVVGGLGFTPICCSYSYDQASFFGNPCVVIPAANFKMYQNPAINDIKVKNPGVKEINGVHTTSYDYTDDQLQEVLDGYREDYSNRNNEILLKCDIYYIVNVRRMLWMCRNSKFNEIKEIKEIKTYKQLIDFIYKFKSYLKWIESRRPQ